MFLSTDRWVCSSCAWMMPNKELCPRCWAMLPEEEGDGGEKICPDCGYELWPPRDLPGGPRKEIWYHPPGGKPYKVEGGTPVLPKGPPKRRSGGGRKGKYKSPLQRRLDDWQKRRRRRGE